MEDLQISDAEVKGFDGVMDFMQEDDDLIAPADGNQMSDLNFEFSESMKGIALAESAENEMNGQQVSQPPNSLGLEKKTRNRKCNLRKSLAWDSAFFTSAGVLDPEELSSMIGGAETGGRMVLPGIQEDDLRSSISTLDSDTLTLESLEAELFQDIRASIQKSNKPVGTVPSPNMSISEEESHTSIPSSTKADLSSDNKAKLAMRSTPKKLQISAAESLKTKKQSHTEVAQANLDDRCKPVSLSRPKLPNGAGKPNNIPPSPAKRVPTGVNHVSTEKHAPRRPISAVGRATQSKLSASSRPPCAVPRPTMTSKASVSVTSKDGKKEMSTLRNSAESSSSVSSSNVAKPSIDSTKKKNASKPTKPPSSTSTLKVPSRITPKASNPPVSKTKPHPGNSSLSAYVNSTVSNISSISPASSVSEWSIDSSSSTSSVSQRFNSQRVSAEAISSSLSEAVEGDHPLAFDPQVQSKDSKMSNNFKSGLEMHSSLPNPAASRPSGLRMPSPKIGFFDGVKSLPRTPKRPVQLNCGLPSGLPKGEGICNPSGNSSNAKMGKIQLQTSVSSNKKDDAQLVASLMKPATHVNGRKVPSSSTKKPGSLEAAKHDPSLSSKLDKGISPKTVGKSHLNPADVTNNIVEGKSHDRCSEQNGTRIGGDVGGTHINDILQDGEDGIAKFCSSSADDLSQQFDKAPSEMALQNNYISVEKHEVASETEVSVKGGMESKGESLDLQRDIIISPITCNGGKTASSDDHSKSEIVNVNCALADGNAVHENSCVGDPTAFTEDKADRYVKEVLLDSVQNKD